MIVLGFFLLPPSSSSSSPSCRPSSASSWATELSVSQVLDNFFANFYEASNEKGGGRRRGRASPDDKVRWCLPFLSCLGFL